MLALIALVTTAYANNIDHINLSNTQPDDDGTCSPTLVVRGFGSFHVFDDDGQPMRVANHAIYLNHTFPAGCEPISGLPTSDQCGPERVYGDDESLWVLDLDPMSEGEYRTLRIASFGQPGTADDWDLEAAVSWSCGACALPADINGDGTVTIADYLDLLTAVGTAVSEGDPRDVDGDGIVGGLDIVEVINSLGDACPDGV